MNLIYFMIEESQGRSTASQKFWDAFKACVEDNRVRPDRSLFYVKWGQAFVNFLPGKRLRDRSRQDIEAFLAHTVQVLPGHADVSTTMIYTHVLNRPGLSVRSPADFD